MSGDSTCRTYMWVDPDPNGTAPDTNNADVKRNSTMPNGFNTITVEIGGNAAAWINYDEIRLGDSWEKVTTSSTTYLAVESFDYATADTIDDAMATPTDGWSDSWLFDAGHTWGSGCWAIVGATDLVYDNMLFPVNNIGKHLTVYTPAAGQERFPMSVLSIKPGRMKLVKFTGQAWCLMSNGPGWTVAPIICSNYFTMVKRKANFSPLEKAAGPVHILAAAVGRVPVVLTFRR
jgi:hypothetical protein